VSFHGPGDELRWTLFDKTDERVDGIAGSVCAGEVVLYGAIDVLVFTVFQHAHDDCSAGV